MKQKDDKELIAGLLAFADAIEKDINIIRNAAKRIDTEGKGNQRHLIIEAPAALDHSPSTIARLEKMIAEAMEKGESGQSASGTTAAMAIKWSEKNGYMWRLEGFSGLGYHVTRGEKIR